MEKIKIDDVNIRKLNIPDVTVFNVDNYTTLPIPLAPSVTVDIGVPIVNIPGCVETHESNNKSKTIKDDDERGVVTHCDAGIPSYNPIQYEPDQIINTSPANVDTRQPKQPEIPKSPEIPKNVVPPAPKIECPSPKQAEEQPIGTYLNGFKEVITGYKLIGNECVRYTEKVPLPTQIVAGLPDGGQVIQVGGVAVIATTSALLAKPLADLLLKAVKPAVKKVVKKIAALRGKTVPTLSVKERQAEQRQMNHAVRELRSVFPRRKKKG